MNRLLILAAALSVAAGLVWPDVPTLLNGGLLLAVVAVVALACSEGMERMVEEER